MAWTLIALQEEAFVSNSLMYKNGESAQQDHGADTERQDRVNTLCLYPAYKPSGVPGLGDVPDHWDKCKLRSVLTAKTERNRPDLALAVSSA